MKKAIIALAAMAASSAALAGPSWTYVDGGYSQQSSFEANGVKSIDGYDLTGSFGFAGIWHINGTWGTATVDVGSDIDIDRYRIGGGVHPAITDSTDFVAEVGYTSWDAKDDLGIEPDAFDLTLGVRSMVSDALELNAFLATNIGSTDTGGDDDFTNFSPSLGGQYFFTENLSVNLSYTWGDVQSTLVQGAASSAKADTTRFGVRWSF